jgi:SAM-dependent methyltransferase
MITEPTSREQEIVAFYTDRRNGGLSLLETWELGYAAGDSVTPSTYCPQYRAWMSRRLLDELDVHGSGRPGSLLSLGCGNAAVELMVAASAHQVLVTDLCDDAVALARRKGLTAVQADVMTYQPDRRHDVVYMDGLLGHLFDEHTGVLPVLERVRPWLTPGGALVASNDAPADGLLSAEAPGVVQFSWLSTDLLRSQALAAGYSSVEVHTFEYDRPVSGTRRRAVIVARTAPAL